jgi:C4-dicarboxylate-specific signal transduction histidine kinase
MHRRAEFGTRVAKLGEGELQAVADACDHRIQEIVTRERKLIEAERMAMVGQFAAGIAQELNIRSVSSAATSTR